MKRRILQFWLFVFGELVLLSSPIAKSADLLPHLVIQCSIYDLNRKIIRSYPGGMCVFLEDGKLLMTSGTGVGLYDQKMHKLWELTMHVHHAITRTKNGDFLVGSSENREYKDQKNVRFDVLHRIGLDGKIRNSFFLSGQIEKINKMFAKDRLGTLFPFEWAKEQFPVSKNELTHMNSYYEIPAHPRSQNAGFLKEGNIVVNLNFVSLIIFVDPELRKIVHVMDSNTLVRSRNIHDVQMLSNGNLILFNNFESTRKEELASSLMEFNPTTGEILWKYQSNPKNSFFNPVAGFVQALPNGHFLFSNFATQPRVTEIDRSGKVKWEFAWPKKIEYSAEGVLKNGFLEARRYNLTDFLTHSQGL